MQNLSAPLVGPLVGPLVLVVAALLVLEAAAGARYENKYCDENGKPRFRECPISSEGGHPCPTNGGKCLFCAHCTDEPQSEGCATMSWMEGYESRKVVCDNGTYYTYHFPNNDCTGQELKAPESPDCYCRLFLRCHTQTRTHTLTRLSFSPEILTSFTYPHNALCCESRL